MAYVDSLGFFATLLFKLLGNEGGAVDRRALRVYDRLSFPLSKSIDMLTGRFFGKNLLWWPARNLRSDRAIWHSRKACALPLSIRERVLDEDPGWFARAERAGLLDLGDVLTVPQLLHDEMLSEPQREATRRALYPGVAPARAARLPVSPLSMAEGALDLVLAANPGAAPRRRPPRTSTGAPTSSS